MFWKHTYFKRRHHTVNFLWLFDTKHVCEKKNVLRNGTWNPLLPPKFPHKALRNGWIIPKHRRVGDLSNPESESQTYYDMNSFLVDFKHYLSIQFQTSEFFQLKHTYVHLIPIISEIMIFSKLFRLWSPPPSHPSKKNKFNKFNNPPFIYALPPKKINE